MSSELLSVYGATGFVGSAFMNSTTSNAVAIERNQIEAESPNILYAIGTTDNYNIFTNPTLDIETNLLLLIQVLEANRKKFDKFTFNFLSSWFVYGDGNLPYVETANCSPKGFYSISKYSAEMFLTSYCRTFGIDYRILRLANVYGPGDKGISKKKNALQFLVGEIKEGRPINLYEGGHVVRDYIHVNDVVSAIDLTTSQGPLNSIINIGTGIPTELLDLMNTARKVFSSESEFHSIPTPEFHKIVQVKDAYLDVSLLKSLGFSPIHKVEEELVNL